MITREKISIYKKYAGDPDAWARMSTSEEKKLMSDDDWFLIDSLIQDIIISQSNLNQKLRSKIDDEEVRNEIILLARNTPT